MPDAQAQPPVPPPADPVESARAIRSGCVWLVLILLMCAALARAWDVSDDPAALRQALPRAALTALAEAAVAFVIALAVYSILPRLGVWIAIALAAVAVCAAAAPVPAAARTHVWLSATLLLLLALAALSTIPAVLYEAAAVDRAGAWFALRTVTLPLVAPLLLMGVLYRTIESLRSADDGLAAVVPHLALAAAVVTGAVLSRGRR